MKKIIAIIIISLPLFALGQVKQEILLNKYYGADSSGIVMSNDTQKVNISINSSGNLTLRDNATGTVTLSSVVTNAKLNILTYYLTHIFTVGTNIKTVIDSNFVSIDSLHTWCTASVVADDGTITPPTAISGWGSVRAYSSGTLSEAVYQFEFNSDGTVTLISNTTNCANSNTDGKLCVYDGGSGIVIKNRLGGSRTLKVKLEY